MLQGAKVRKLHCKHMFHDQCVLNWILSHNISPQCPMCKSNPFEPIFSAVDPNQSALEASQLHLQVDDNSHNDEGFRLDDSASSRSPVQLAGP